MKTYTLQQYRRKTHNMNGTSGSQLLSLPHAAVFAQGADGFMTARLTE